MNHSGNVRRDTSWYHVLQESGQRLLSAFLRFFLCFYYAEVGMPRSRAAQCAAGPRPAPSRCPPCRCRGWIIVKKVDKYAIIKDTKRMSKNDNKEKSQIHQRIPTNHRQSILHSDNDWLPWSHEHHISALCRVLRVNRSSYYKFLNHTPSARDKDNAYIRSCILAKNCRSFFLFMRYSWFIFKKGYCL